jgi:hypothetical protein
VVIIYVIRYIYSLGGRAALLPKTITTCWDKLRRVR